MNKIEKVDILQIPVSTISKKSLKVAIKKSLEKDLRTLFIATVNPSFLVKAYSNKKFKHILTHKTSINVPDGVGIQLAAEYSIKCNTKNIFHKVAIGLMLGVTKTFLRSPFEILKNRITGIDITNYLLSQCENSKSTVIVVLRKDGLTSLHNISEYIRSRHPKLKFKLLGLTTNNTVEIPQLTHYKVLLCGLGEYKQEEFICNNLINIKPNIAVGIGGTFDVLVKNKGADSLMGQYGLSWVLRLWSNPSRIRKIITSVVIFPLLVFWDSVRT